MTYTFFAIWLALSVSQFIADFHDGRRGLLNFSLVLAIGVLAVIITGTDRYLAMNAQEPDPFKIAYLHTAEEVNRTIACGKPVVVGTFPYYYTVATGAQSLSIPQSDDSYLLEYMKKYGAKYILLSESEREFWKPGWKLDADSAPGIRFRQSIGKFFVFEATGG